MPSALSALEHDLQSLLSRGAKPRELAFYGGTFTAMPHELQRACLDLAARFRNQGLVSRIRVSTRPDSIGADTLPRLRDAGVDMVELGVQSFSDQALHASDRGYTGDLAHDACVRVKEEGLALGIQLLPGLISESGAMSEDEFTNDVGITASLTPQAVRLYPCLVLHGTGLEKAWLAGKFHPWPLEETIARLAQACLVFRDRNIPVIRIGVAPQPGLEEYLVAGPAHPCLGSRVRAKTLFLAIRRAAKNHGFSRLAVPRYLQGEIFGHRNELRPAYQSLSPGLSAPTWIDNACIHGYA